MAVLTSSTLSPQTVRTSSPILTEREHFFSAGRGGGGSWLGGGAHFGEQLVHDPLVRLRGGRVVVRLKLASAGVVVAGAVECIVSRAAPLETRPKRVELLGLGVERGRGRDDGGRARLLLRQRLVQLIPTTIEDRKRILERTDILGSNSIGLLTDLKIVRHK